MKRVLFLNHAGIVGGAELTLLDIARRYRETSTVVLFADGSFRSRLEDERVRVEVLQTAWALQGARKRTTWPSFRSLAEVARTARAVSRLARSHDVLYSNSRKALIVASAARSLTRRPVLWHLHDLFDLDHFSRFNIAFDVLLANWFTERILANSGATAEAFRRWGGRANKLHVLPYGIEASRFEPIDTAELAAVRRELSLGRFPTVGLFGRLTPWKGQHVMIDALPAMPGVQALVVGEATPEEAGYADVLRDQARRLGVKDRVHFLGFRRDVPLLMQLVDLVLHTSTAPEPLGRVIVEGMLAGRPVIATRTGGASEIIEDGVTGVLLRPGKPAELATTVMRLLGQPGRAGELAAAGRAHAIAHFSLEAMLTQIERHINEVTTCAGNAR
jgi:glycosyltransferase involved in cell wall biosynthesis